MSIRGPLARPMGLAKTRVRTKTEFLVAAAVAWSEAAIRHYPDEAQKLADLLNASHDMRRTVRVA